MTQFLWVVEFWGKLSFKSISELLNCFIFNLLPHKLAHRTNVKCFCLPPSRCSTHPQQFSKLLPMKRKIDGKFHFSITLEGDTKKFFLDLFSNLIKISFIFHRKCRNCLVINFSAVRIFLLTWKGQQSQKENLWSNLSPKASPHVTQLSTHPSNNFKFNSQHFRKGC